MNSPIEIGMGELGISASKEDVFVTLVGSCVAVCLFDPHTNIGGMAHVMLPESSRENMQKRNGAAKYGDEAVDNLLRMMQKKNADQKRIKAKLVGGATLFTNESGNGLFSIGDRNVSSLKQFLKKKGIPIIAEDTGLNYGRRVIFNLHSGEVIVRSKKDGERRV